MPTPNNVFNTLFPTFCNTLLTLFCSRFSIACKISAGRYVIDAKSIMGIFSLDLSKPIKLQAHTDDADKLVEAIGKYIVK